MSGAEWWQAQMGRAASEPWRKPPPERPRSPLIDLPARAGIRVAPPDSHGHREAWGRWGHVWDEPGMEEVFLARFPCRCTAVEQQVVWREWTEDKRWLYVVTLPFGSVTTAEVSRFLRYGFIPAAVGS